MQNVSELYNSIITSENHWFEVSLAIGDSGRLIDEYGDTLLFGDTAILVDTGGAETGFRETSIISMSTSNSVFKEDYPVVGSAISAEIDVQMLNIVANIPKRARLAPFVRVTDGVNRSEWLPKGVFYIDTRKVTHNNNGIDVFTLHGYDAMLMLEQNYPSDTEHDYPMLDTDMVAFIAESIRVPVDARTYERMTAGYHFPLPIGYSSREVLGIIASAYGGNFVMSDEGALLLIKLGDLPRETNYLSTQNGDVLVFGVAPNDVKLLV